MNWNIYENGVLINTIHAAEEFARKYCKNNGYTYAVVPVPKPEPKPEAEPTQLDIIEAQVAYTAMMTDTLLEV